MNKLLFLKITTLKKWSKPPFKLFLSFNKFFIGFLFLTITLFLNPIPLLFTIFKIQKNNCKPNLTTYMPNG
ncbi:hypothetical protein DUT90_01970 [Polaribacter sp. WD7]|nr:hypothetical protein DUT90_01970 [Polaribacter sp. WD7]